MKVSEAIEIQREFIANKYHIFRVSNKELKESMKVLTNNYCKLWDYLEKNHEDVLDEYLMQLEE